MKKIVIVFISLILIVPASGQIYLEQVYPPDIGKPERDYPAYFGCIDYGKEGGDISIVPVEAYQDFGWEAYTYGATPDHKLCVKSWDVVPPDPPGSDVKVADLNVGADHFDVFMYSSYHYRITTTPGGDLLYVGFVGPWPSEPPPTLELHYAYIPHNEIWVTLDSSQPLPLDIPALSIYAIPRQGYKFVGLSGTPADMGYAYGIPIEGTQMTDVRVDIGDYFANVPEQCFIEVIFAKSVPTELDIKPNSNPNSINLKANGVVPVAILGNEDFDVTDIDPSTILLEGIAPVRWNIEDVLYDNPEYDPVSNPSVPPLIGDGIDDIVFQFLRQELRVPLNASSTTATLTGELLDGTPITLTDFVNIVKY